MRHSPGSIIHYAGTHVVADFWFGKIIENPSELKRILFASAKKSGNTPLEFSFHKFSPQGITGVLLLAESHIALHTWPEIQYCAIDIFTCGQASKPERALAFLRRALRPKKVVIHRVKRGEVTKEIYQKL